MRDFVEDAGLNRYDTTAKDSRDGFAEFMIIGCQHSDWWYHPHIGEQFMGVFYLKVTLRDVTVVAFRGKRIVRGRSIDIKDVIML